MMHVCDYKLQEHAPTRDERKNTTMHHHRRRHTIDRRRS